MTLFLFYFFSAVSIISALLVIGLPKPTRALLCLIVTMFALAVLYLLLGAPFVAMAHLIVYAGAVLILFLFVIMLQGLGATDIPLGQRFSQGYLLLAGFVAGAFILTFAAIAKIPFANSSGIFGTVENIGHALFHHYVLPFELTSLLLLLGVFAAVSLAKKEDA